MALETTRFAIQNYIKSLENQTGYLDAVLEDGDPGLIAAAIADIARARGAELAPCGTARLRMLRANRSL
ncbi:hypothetical protein SAMN05216228_10116 [Rhizobium tibeticum]|uniref:Putative addiction module antidote protein n=1 Tax=Rhizobium tibeticum TaxID=501024 RepID=A0A1H8LHY4_9HYPH|nr:hypothetical protein [Rhizobium tibeticum]SEH91190.1 putative addiction module antidote protein [Rhizobium tibeticum]SEO04812.1 hypothetical protein SAMN05216228_10116 [Rhizobium tibeticum]